VKTVSSGEEAVAFLRQKSVDVVILDMVMEPGMNGKQTYEQIIKINPGQKAMLVSGFAMNDDIRAALDLGVSTFLKKPYTMEELANSLHKTLRD
jgi:YesN/AraC family two-component response regulator